MSWRAYQAARLRAWLAVKRATWRLRVRSLACRVLGHKPVRLVRHRPGRMVVGDGCVRCEQGTVSAYEGRYPLPRVK